MGRQAEASVFSVELTGRQIVLSREGCPECLTASRLYIFEAEFCFEGEAGNTLTWKLP